MSLFLKSSPFARFVTRAAVVGAATVALVLPAGSLVRAQQAEESSAKLDREPLVFTIDVAEDLAGKFVPTLVKPEHTQPERGSFFITEGRIFPGGTIQGDGAELRSQQKRPHRCVVLPRHAPGLGVRDSCSTAVGRQRAVVRARPARQGTAGDRRGRRRRHRHAHRDRRRWQLRGLHRRTAPDVPRIQPHRRGQPEGHVHPAAGRR